MEPQLRRLNLPISLQKGVIHMDKEHTVCNEGDTLTPEQSQILVCWYVYISTLR